jgi:ribulose kinase
MSSDIAYYIGVDVGSTSVRVGIITKPKSLDEKTIVATVVKPIQTFTPKPEYYEQSSNDIWNSLCEATKEVLQKAKLQPNQIKGIGFDATCNLVVLDRSDNPISISSSKDPSHNVIMWMDHRALKQANLINDTSKFPKFLAHFQNMKCSST